MTAVRQAPRPPFESVPSVKRADGKPHRPCPMCGDVLPTGRGWWHPACVELWRYAAFPGTALGLLLELHGRVCWGCGAKRTEEHAAPFLELEHVRPLWSLNAEERRELKWWMPFNLQLLCRACHRAKTARETRERFSLKPKATPAPQLELLAQRWAS